MLCDLNVPWPDQPAASAVKTITPVLQLLEQLGYTTAALNYVHLPKSKITVSPISKETLHGLQALVPKLKLITRITFIMEGSTPTHSFSPLSSCFDVIAVRPTTEKSLQSAATALDVDLISFNMATRIPFHIKHRTACAAVERGVRFEVSYAPCIENPESRRHCIANAATISRATRGRGIVASSGVTRPAGVRAPFDVVNLVTVWGIPSHTARESVGKAAKAAILNGYLRLNSAKQVVVVYESDERPEKKRKLSRKEE